MTDEAPKRWANYFGGGDPFEDAPPEGYSPWRTSSKGWVRDLKFVPAASSEELVRFEPYMQAITLELKPDGSQLCLMCHTSDQLILITGRGLDELAEMISAKRIASVHVWDEAIDGPKPDGPVVLRLRFSRTAMFVATDEVSDHHFR